MGKLRILSVLTIWLLPVQLFAAASIDVQPSSTDIGEDENVAIEITVTTDERNAEISTPKYETRDFEEVNSYGGMSGVQTTIINGRISMQRTEQITVVLHPKKTGALTIRGISVTVGGKTVKGPDVTINVTSAGQQRRSQSAGNNYYNQQNVMPRAGVQPTKGSVFFIRTEPSKRKVYKGEQIVLTYALYTRTDILNIAVERYPTVPGFLKEDLDIPLLQMRLHFQPTIVNGQEYNRAVLAQYAVFPVKEGVLPIDSFTGKFTYRSPRARANLLDDDPFAVLNQFMRSAEAQVDSRSSDVVKVEVLPLPGEGQPANFSGLVGDFDIEAEADKTVLKTGEALGVKIKVSGKGHAGSLERINPTWPADFEQYEDKSKTTFFKTGNSERVFEYMLIPRVKGKFEIPSIELSMFNPESHSYQIKKTQPLTIEVMEGSGSSVYVPKIASDKSITTKQDIRYWMASEPSTPVLSTVVNSASKGSAALSLAFLMLNLFGFRARDEKTGAHKKKLSERKQLLEKAEGLLKLEGQAETVLGEIENGIVTLIKLAFGINAGSLTRAQLREMLSTKNVEQSTITKIDALMERAAGLRYLPGSGQGAPVKELIQSFQDLVKDLV